jgi:hypothetical protein
MRATPDMWNASTALFGPDDPKTIAGRLDHLGWRGQLSYGRSDPRVTVCVMSGAIGDGELWLNIRGPVPTTVPPARLRRRAARIAVRGDHADGPSAAHEIP